MVGMADNFDMGVDEDAIEELVQVVPEELMSEELLEPKREYIADEKAREMETAVEEIKEQPKNFTGEWLVGAFANLNKFLKSLNTWTSNTEMFY